MNKDNIKYNLGEEYCSHLIFLDLKVYIDFYYLLADSVARFFNLGLKDIINFETYLLSSIQGTIESIELVLGDGKINDAYALTRKYDDSVLIHIYTISYLENNFNIENNMVVKQIYNWLKGREKLPTYKKMNNYIQNNSNKLKKMNKLLNVDAYLNIRTRCNDHIHYNYFQYMMSNDNAIYNPMRITFLNQLSSDIRHIFIKHLILLFTLNDIYMMSSYYMDCLDVGETPPEGSQYLISSFIQDVFDNVIKVYEKDLAEEFKKTTSMELV
ncbi:MAG: hypothetical protein ACYCT7_06920 [bacterium]